VTNMSPVTKLASCEARKTKAGASSAGCPARFNAVFSPNFGNFSCGCPPVTWRGVQTGPGATAFTRMRRFASCFESDFAKFAFTAFVDA
jgi:hypothetical protein